MNRHARDLVVFRRIKVSITVFFLALLSIYQIRVTFFLANITGFGTYQIQRQDIFVIPALLLATYLFINHAKKKEEVANAVYRHRNLLLLSVSLVLIVAVCWLGRYLVFDNCDMIRDTQMADFDAFIFAHGRLFWPIPPVWRPIAKALNLEFTLHFRGHAAWVSAYLPINAASRALVGLVADRQLTSPLFTAIGAAALWSVSRRLWPRAPEVRVAALLLYVSSSQIIITGMTPYAMSGHLALNLVWLALFLRGRPLDHAAAILIGFLATGLHQPLFHPMFAVPFLDLLRQRKQWRLLSIYLAAYLVIGLFWMAWPIWITSHTIGALAPTGAHGKQIGYLGRLVDTVHMFDFASAWLMAVNLMRFSAWQNLVFLPLLLLGIRWRWRHDPLARAMTISFFLPILVMAIILPQQGHGWGYRYMHGVLGNGCLLGAYGWQFLERRGHAVRRAFLGATAASVLILLPVHGWMAHRMVAPYARVNAEIARLNADVAIVDVTYVMPGGDLVNNRPDLGNRPIRLMGGELTPADMPRVCRGRTIAFFNRPKLAPIERVYDLPPAPHASAHQIALERAAKADGCKIVPTGERS